MHNIIYMSNADRARLLELQETLPRVTDIEERNKISEEIATINNRVKPLHECNIEECTELRTTVFDKFNKLNRTGKYGMAQQFKVMLQAIELRQHTIYLEMKKKELEEKKSKETKKEETITNEERSTTDSKRKSSKSRWTVGVGNLD